MFLDQFGYSDVPVDVVRRIMKHAQCEVFTYLNYRGLARFLSDPSKDAARTAAFGNDTWRQGRKLDEEQRKQYLLHCYKQSLQKIGGARYVWDFAMEDEHGVLIYWLFFCTNNLRGLEEMKAAMRRVDRTGGFRFADDTDRSQLRLFEEFNDEWLAEHLGQTFAGQVRTVAEIKEYVLVQTPCHKYANAMHKLLGKRTIYVSVEGRKKKQLSFAKELNLKVRFANPGR